MVVTEMVVTMRGPGCTVLPGREGSSDRDPENLCEGVSGRASGQTPEFAVRLDQCENTLCKNHPPSH